MGHRGSVMPATSMELHILNTLTVLVYDCLECLELPGVHFPSLKTFQDIWKDSFLSKCLRFNADDYSRAGLISAWTLFSLVWPAVWHEQWMWVFAKIKDWSNCINCCPTILNVVMILCHLWTPSLLFICYSLRSRLWVWFSITSRRVQMTDRRSRDKHSTAVPPCWLVASAPVARAPSKIMKSRPDAARPWLLLVSQDWSVVMPGRLLRDWQDEYVLLPISCCIAIQFESKSLLDSIILKPASFVSLWKHPHIYNSLLLVTYKPSSLVVRIKQVPI